MRWLRRNLIIAALGLLKTTGALAAAESLQLLLADTTVNHVERGEAFLLWDGVGDFYAAEPELLKWRVRRPFPEPVVRDDVPYYRLRDLPGANASLDMRTMSIAGHAAAPCARAATAQYSQAATRRTRPRRPGLYLDYDLAYMSDELDRYPFAFLAPTLFGSAGVLHSEFLYRGLDTPAGELEDFEQFVRLDTTFTRDDPGQMRAYRAGDVLSAPGPWGASLRLGGLQVASNFATQPSLVTFPVPYLEAAAQTPSTVDLYIDGVLRYRDNVDAGFFPGRPVADHHRRRRADDGRPRHRRAGNDDHTRLLCEFGAVEDRAFRILVFARFSAPPLCTREQRLRWTRPSSGPIAGVSMTG